MTTIVYRDGVMASDSQITDRGIVVAEEKKIIRYDGTLIGVAGNLDADAAFLEWVKFEQTDKPDLKNSDFEALVVRQDGTMLWYGVNLIPLKMTSPYIAIGSGFHVAMGALHLGANAKEAVQVACDLDVLSGGTIQVEKL